MAIPCTAELSVACGAPVKPLTRATAPCIRSGAPMAARHTDAENMKRYDRCSLSASNSLVGGCVGNLGPPQRRASYSRLDECMESAYANSFPNITNS